MNEGEIMELQELAHLMKGDPWAAGDLLLRKFPEGEYPATKAKNDLYKALERWSIDAETWIGEKLSVGTMRQARATALAWDHEIRISSATFGAHQALRGQADRVEQLTLYVKRAQKEGHRVLTLARLRSYRQGEAQRAPSAPRSFPEAFRAKVSAAAKAAVLPGTLTGPEWWKAGNLTQQERDTMAAELEGLARSIRNG